MDLGVTLTAFTASFRLEDITELALWALSAADDRVILTFHDDDVWVFFGSIYWNGC